jgi:hypothetical protein
MWSPYAHLRKALVKEIAANIYKAELFSELRRFLLDSVETSVQNIATSCASCGRLVKQRSVGSGKVCAAGRQLRQLW